MKVDKILVSNPFKGNQALKKGAARGIPQNCDTV